MSSDIRHRFQILHKEGLSAREFGRRLLIPAATDLRFAACLRQTGSSKSAANSRRQGHGRLRHAKVPVDEMARVLKCCRSTIFRELKRNHFSDDCIPKCYGYYGAAAQLMAADRCARQHKLIKYPELFKRVLAENEITRGLPGKYVDSYEYPERRLEFRWKGVSLPYSVFDKDQRVTHAAITENKRLGAVLQFIKEEQDKAPPKKPRAGKQRSHYKPNGRRNDGWNSLAARRAEEDREASRGCDI